MKRMKIMGLCLVAVFEVSIMASAAASAEAPEFGRCLAKTGGKFSDAGSTKGVASKGKFEWTAGLEKSKFTSAMTTGSATLETVKGTKITCTKESSPGEFKANNKEVAGVIAKFNECVTSGLKCKSTGAAEGEIITSSLEGQLGVEKKGATKAADKLALELHAPAGQKVAEFSCAGLPVVVMGSVLHPVVSNKMLLTAVEKFTATKGEQKPSEFAGEPADSHILESNTNGGPFEEAGQTITATATYEEKVEASSVN